MSWQTEQSEYAKEMGEKMLQTDKQSGNQYEEWQGWVLWRIDTEAVVEWSADDGDQPSWYSAKSWKPRFRPAVQTYTEARVSQAGYGAQPVRVAQLLSELYRRAILEAEAMNQKRAVPA